MATDRGWLWHHFEDTCCGPLAWDLAASTASQYQDGPRVLAAYGYPVDPQELAVCDSCGGCTSPSGTACTPSACPSSPRGPPSCRPAGPPAETAGRPAEPNVN